MQMVNRQKDMSQPETPDVIVLHAWWGLNQFFKNLCDRLAAEGFLAFAPDLKREASINLFVQKK